MSLFETIGMAWVIFTSTLATLEVIYLAIVGLRALVRTPRKEVESPVEVKEMFKVAR